MILMKRQSELQPDYESYILRLWHDKTTTPHHCRIMLQHVVTQQQHFFTDLSTLLMFLTQILEGEDAGHEQTQSQQPKTSYTGGCQ